MTSELTNERVIEIFGKSRGSEGARLLGFKLIDADLATGATTASFDLDERFANPRGVIQGGFLIAALDETMTVAAIVKSQLTIYAPSLEIKASFIRAVKPGIVKVEGRVVRLAKSIVFLEGTLFDLDGNEAVKATATSQVRLRTP